MKKIVLNIEGMTCSACSNGLEKYLNKQKGVKEASVNLVLATLMIEYDDNVLSKKDLEKFVLEAGFKSTGENNNKNSKNIELIKLIIFAILSIILMYISMGHMLKLPIPSFVNMEINPLGYGAILMILSIPFLFYGFDILKNGIKNIIHKMPNMDSLVGIGILVNFLYSMWNLILVYEGDISKVHNLYFEASSMIILFVKLGRFIDKRNKSKAVDTIKNLVTITPKGGTILVDGKEKSVTINEIQKGDIVVCKPGEKIAVDGIIIKGKTHTDESFITGESKPVVKKAGSTVIAGSINYDGYIEYKAEKIGKDSSISNIVNLVVEATNTKAPIARIADVISGYFVPAIFVISIISFVLNLIIIKDITEAVISLVSVLVVACPCALGLATPLAMVISIGRYSKKGILIKSSESIEALNKIDTIVFDKTGTLTTGKLTIIDSKIEKENMFALKSLEKNSNHPIAKSIVGQEKGDLYPVTNFTDVPGLGIKGIINQKEYYAGNRKFINEINPVLNENGEYLKIEKEFLNKGETIVYLFDKDNILGIVGLSDKIKPEIKDVITKLQEIGKKIVMLTGDNKESAKIIGEELGIKEIISNVTPEEKLNKIKELNTNKNCMMVGDGVNDSPALKTATIGVSVHGGTDISQDSADIILLNDNMYILKEMFEISNKTIKIIKENLFWALFYNICMIPLATGLFAIHINPMLASLAMTLSSFTVVVNSLRLLK